MKLFLQSPTPRTGQRFMWTERKVNIYKMKILPIKLLLSNYCVSNLCDNLLLTYFVSKLPQQMPDDRRTVRRRVDDWTPHGPGPCGSGDLGIRGNRSSMIFFLISPCLLAVSTDLRFNHTIFRLSIKHILFMNLH